MKKHNILKVVLLSIFIVFLCTWIFPIAYVNYDQLVESTREQLGLFDLFSYPLIAFNFFSHIFLYVLVCGLLYGVLYKIPAYRVLLEKIKKGFEGREWIFLSVTMVVLAAITSAVGFSFGLIVLFPMLISLILLMGYNKLVAASVTVGSVVVGMIGNTFAVDIFSYVNTVLGTTYASELGYKAIILFLSLGLLMFHTLRYAKKTKNQNVDVKEELIPQEIKVEKGKKVRVWPLVVIFDLMLVILLMGCFPWQTIFPEFTAFSDALTWLQEYELFGFPIFYKVLGNVQAFGEWTYSVGQIPVATFPVLIVFTALILALVYRVKWNDLLDGICNGMKKAVKPAAIMILIYMILIIATYHPFQLLFTKALLGLTEGFNVVTMSIVAFLASLFNVEALYQVQSTLPYVATVITDESLYPIIAVIFQSIYGLAMLVVPSSVILMGTLDYLGVSYGNWLKHIWKLFVAILIVLLVIFLIMLAL